MNVFLLSQPQLNNLFMYSTVHPYRCIMHLCASICLWMYIFSYGYALMHATCMERTIFFSTHFGLYTPSTLFMMFRFIWCFLCQIFSPYGFVEDIYILRDEMRQNRGISIFLIVDLSILYNFELHAIDWAG